MTPARKAAKKRNKMRREAAADEAREVILSPLRERGETCASCWHYRQVAGMPKRICDLDSDFSGFVTPKPTDLCARWRPAP